MRSSFVNVALTTTATPGRARTSGGDRLLHLAQVRLRLDHDRRSTPPAASAATCSPYASNASSGPTRP